MLDAVCALGPLVAQLDGAVAMAHAILLLRAPAARLLALVAGEGRFASGKRLRVAVLTALGVVPVDDLFLDATDASVCAATVALAA